MGYLLDTNVLSELRRRTPNPQVRQWFADRPASTLYLSVLTLGEIGKGIEGLSDPVRRLPLIDWLETELPAFFAGRILPVDVRVADGSGGWWRKPVVRCRPLTACWPRRRWSTG